MIPALRNPARRQYRCIPHVEQVRRRRELDEIRMQRPLTLEEQIEDDDLANRFAKRIYRSLGR